MKRLLLLVCGIAALLIVSSALAAATTVFGVSASSSHASVSHWQTNRAGNLTLTLRYSSKGVPAFNAYPVGADGLPTAGLSGQCATTSGAGFITYTCVNAPASLYEADIWPSKGTLSGTLIVVGETD